MRFEIDPEIVKVIAWCRIGGLRYRPVDDTAAHRAKALGLLAQDSTWRATEKGEGVLIVLGLLDGQPAPERACVKMLWARSSRYDRPQFVCSWAEGLGDAWPDEAARIRAESEAWFRDFGDGTDVWSFWTTTEHIDRPAVTEEAILDVV